jgi:hypothetical protein
MNLIATCAAFPWAVGLKRFESLDFYVYHGVVVREGLFIAWSRVRPT